MPKAEAVFLVILAWHLIGAMVLASIDGDGALKKWADNAPLGLDMLVLTAWPIILVFWWKFRHDRRKL